MATKDKYKKNKGNSYTHNNEFAEEVTEKNVKHPVVRSPRRFGNK